MTELFLTILNASFAASWGVLAVVLARLMLKKAPRWVVCALWVLVAVRLLWPMLPQSPISLIPSAEVISPDSLYARTPMIHSGLPLLDNVVNPAYSDSLRPATGASVNPLQIWLAVFANLWVLGAAVMAIWALISCLRVRWQVRESIRDRDNIFLCDRIDTPFIFGLLHPGIYLPSGLSEEEKRHVLAHEMAHLHRRDHWWKPLGFLLLSVHWFNPAMWLAYILLCRDIEMAADERVVRTLDLPQKKAYSSSLLSCSVSRRSIAVCPLAFGEVGVRQRVRSVLHYKKPAFWAVPVSLVLVVLLAACTLTNPVEQTSELCYNGELYVLFSDDYSFLPADDPVGTLRSILHGTTEHPTEELQATNLDESLAGCPVYQEGDQLYLVKFDGTCLAFRRSESSHTIDLNDLPDGEIVCTLPTRNPDPILGISLSVRDVSPRGLTVQYTQSGGPENLREIITAPGWTLEKWEDGDGWINMLPDDVVWPEIVQVIYPDSDAAWSVNVERVCGTLPSGLYRIGMTFHGHPEPDDIKSTAEAITAVCCAEFEINSLGITLEPAGVNAGNLTLLCHQSGGNWDEITTGSDWRLERLTSEGWISVLPEDTTWTAIAYGVNKNDTIRWNLNWEPIVGKLEPGTYRAGKTFTGTNAATTTSETIYTEFTI